MTDYVWYPVTGNGTSVATAYQWNNAQANWNTGSWIVGDALIFGNPAIVPGNVPGSGAGSGAGKSAGPGLDSVGLVAGEINTTGYDFYEFSGFLAGHNGNPFIGSNDYKVDLLINAGTVDLASLLLAGFNTFADTGIAEFPTVDVEGATFKLEGSIIDTFSAGFPTFGTETASGGGTIDLGNHATVDVAGSVQADIVMQFENASLLKLGAVTSTDTAAFNGTIAGFGTGDVIDLNNLTFSAGNTVSFDGTTDLLSINNGTTTLAALQLSGTYASSDFHLQADTTGGTEIVAPCFVEGTRIVTERGTVPVEALRPGDRVPVVIGGKAQPVTWLGHRRVDCRRHPSPIDVWPICLSAGAFGPGRPFRDLWVSPDHALFVNGVLVPARYLVNGRTIRQEPRDEVTYWHVELPGHNVLYAEGVPAESYLDTGNRGAFANAGPVMHLHPNFARYVWQTQGCAPLVVCGANVAAAKRRLLARAELLGHATTDEPNLTVVWANVRKLRAEADGRTWRVRIPRTARTLRLVSRTWIPAHLEPDNDDLRTLGVAITRLWLDAREAALDSPAFASGWHAPELEWRWTDGNAVLAVSGVRELVFEMATAKGTYWRDNESAVARAA